MEIERAPPRSREPSPRFPVPAGRDGRQLDRSEIKNPPNRFLMRLSIKFPAVLLRFRGIALNRTTEIIGAFLHGFCTDWSDNFTSGTLNEKRHRGKRLFLGCRKFGLYAVVPLLPLLVPNRPISVFQIAVIDHARGPAPEAPSAIHCIIRYLFGRLLLDQHLHLEGLPRLQKCLPLLLVRQEIRRQSQDVGGQEQT